jgi:hypothetical protein
VAIAGLAIRCSAKSRAEERTAVGWDAVESLGGCEPHLFKTDMLIVPAWVTLDARRSCQVTFTGARPGATLTGWIAIDDDSAKLRPEGRWSMSIEIRPADSAASREWQVVRAQPVRHRPGRAMLAIDLGELGDEAIDVRMILEASGTPPAAAFDLELEGSP